MTGLGLVLATEHTRECPIINTYNVLFDSMDMV